MMCFRRADSGLMTEVNTLRHELCEARRRAEELKTERGKDAEAVRRLLSTHASELSQARAAAEEQKVSSHKLLEEKAKLQEELIESLKLLRGRDERLGLLRRDLADSEFEADQLRIAFRCATDYSLELEAEKRLAESVVENVCAEIAHAATTAAAVAEAAARATAEAAAAAAAAASADVAGLGSSPPFLSEGSEGTTDTENVSEGSAGKGAAGEACMVSPFAKNAQGRQPERGAAASNAADGSCGSAVSGTTNCAAAGPLDGALAACEARESTSPGECLIAANPEPTSAAGIPESSCMSGDSLRCRHGCGRRRKPCATSFRRPKGPVEEAVTAASDAVSQLEAAAAELRAVCQRLRQVAVDPLAAAPCTVGSTGPGPAAAAHAHARAATAAAAAAAAALGGAAGVRPGGRAARSLYPVGSDGCGGEGSTGSPPRPPQTPPPAVAALLPLSDLLSAFKPRRTGGETAPEHDAAVGGLRDWGYRRHARTAVCAPPEASPSRPTSTGTVLAVPASPTSSVLPTPSPLGLSDTLQGWACHAGGDVVQSAVVVQGRRMMGGVSPPSLVSSPAGSSAGSFVGHQAPGLGAGAGVGPHPRFTCGHDAKQRSLRPAAVSSGSGSLGGGPPPPSGAAFEPRVGCTGNIPAAAAAATAAALAGAVSGGAYDARCLPEGSSGSRGGGGPETPDRGRKGLAGAEAATALDMEVVSLRLTNEALQRQVAELQRHNDLMQLRQLSTSSHQAGGGSQQLTPSPLLLSTHHSGGGGGGASHLPGSFWGPPGAAGAGAACQAKQWSPAGASAPAAAAAAAAAVAAAANTSSSPLAATFYYGSLPPGAQQAWEPVYNGPHLGHAAPPSPFCSSVIDVSAGVSSGAAAAAAACSTAGCSSNANRNSQKPAMWMGKRQGSPTKPMALALSPVARPVEGHTEGALSSARQEGPAAPACEARSSADAALLASGAASKGPEEGAAAQAGCCDTLVRQQAATGGAGGEGPSGGASVGSALPGADKHAVGAVAPATVAVVAAPPPGVDAALWELELLVACSKGSLLLS